VDSASEPTSGSDQKMGSQLDQKDLSNPSGRSLHLEKPSATPTSRFTRFSSDFPSRAVKNASGLSIPGPTVLWPDGRNSDELIDGEGVDKSCMVSMVEGGPVKGENLGGREPSGTLGTKGRPEYDPGKFRDEVLDLKLANRQGKAEQGSRGARQPCSRHGCRTWAMISGLTC
jgi:hypothetical protein